MNNIKEKIKLLSGANDEIVFAIEQVGWEKVYQIGEPVSWEGDNSEAVYFVISGAVEIFRNALDGREHTLGIMQPGDSFNLVPILSENRENLANARCIRQSTIFLVGQADFLSILQRYPDFSVIILKEVAARLAKMTHKAGELALYSVQQRLARFLINEADKALQGEQLFWTRDDMARQIGTVRDVVSRHLRIFEEQGLIKRVKGKVRLIDRQGLENTAEGRNAT